MSGKRENRTNQTHRRSSGGLAGWWRQHRTWVAGLNRGQKIRYRLFQALVVLAILAIAFCMAVRAWVTLPTIPNLPSGTVTGEDGGMTFDGAELPNVQKDLPTKRFEVPRLSELAGGPVVFVLRGLPYGRVQELQRLAEDVELHILLSGCVEPDLKAPALLGRYNAPTPAEAVRCLLLPGEIEDLSREVERLSGYRMATIRELKNA